MLTRRHLIATLAAAPALAAAAGAEPVHAEGSVAIDGTDPVAYFTKGRPVAGDPALSHTWNGATWRFASAANRAAFAAEPESYAPQYGGWCAWAVAEGYLAPTVPEAWAIVDGMLYLDFSRRIQRRWERDIPGHIARGDANWPGLRG